jgi:general stress protein 26
MPTPEQLEQDFWQALQADRTMMLGLDGVADGQVRPMAALVDGEHGPIWFFTTTESALVTALRPGSRAIATFTAKGHTLFASIHGSLALDHDPAVIDRLWSNAIAAWYTDGKADPKIALLRFDAERAEIWEKDSTLLAGIKLLFGADRKVDTTDKVATVALKRA